MPIFDFNQNLYQFRREGYCPNPNADIKGYVITSKSGLDKVECEEKIDDRNVDL